MHLHKAFSFQNLSNREPAALIPGQDRQSSQNSEFYTRQLTGHKE